MSKDYKPLWKELGLDLQKHDGLLSVLSDSYKNIYLSQKNRPKGMEYFDFVISEVHGLRIEEIYEAKKQNRKIIGTFCVYVPEELILAVNGVCIGLCAGAEVGFDEAEKYVPRNTCALIKAFMGFKLSGLCPYVELTDMIVGETTCDGKKKAYEIFNDITKKVYVMEIPNMKSQKGKDLWVNEVSNFKQKLEDLSRNTITLDSLKMATKIVNDKRKALQRLNRLRSYNPSPISGLDALLINQVSFYDDPIRFSQSVNNLCDELENRINNTKNTSNNGAKRILISGSPMAIPNWKLHAVLEGSNAIVVGEESCVGSRNWRDVVDDNFNSVDEGIRKIADRYLNIDCACFTPNNDRIDNIKKMFHEQNADGVIHYALQFCTLYMMESHKIEKNVDFPYIRIETDYSMEDFGQLKTRVEAFIETL